MKTTSCSVTPREDNIPGKFMKKITFIMLLAIISVSIINAEEKYSFQIKPFMYILSGVMSGINENHSGLADIEFQYAINKNFTLFINPSFVNAFSFLIVRSGMDYSYLSRNYQTTFYSCNGLSLITGLLYRPYSTGLHGIYLGVFPVIGWGYINKNTEKIREFLNIGYMMETGYEWILNYGFTVTFGAGICKIYHTPITPVLVAKNSPIVGDDYFEYNNNPYGINFWNLPFDARLRISIGYSF
jgi:hypothetical protein